MRADPSIMAIHGEDLMTDRRRAYVRETWPLAAAAAVLAGLLAASCAERPAPEKKAEEPAPSPVAGQPAPAKPEADALARAEIGSAVAHQGAMAAIAPPE